MARPNSSFILLAILLYFYYSSIIKMSIKSIIETPLDDADIRKYIPNVKILTYSQLKQYKTIDRLLTPFNPYCILLYESSPNNGHWVCILRYRPEKNEDEVIEYFDSYGNEPDEPLTWIDNQTRDELGYDECYLTDMFDDTPKEVIYNDYKYQREKKDINNCGRYCVLRILLNKKRGYDLEQFNKFMSELKDDWKENYDVVVSRIIDMV
jgi:hypothetical protein